MIKPVYEASRVDKVKGLLPKTLVSLMMLSYLYLGFLLVILCLLLEEGMKNLIWFIFFIPGIANICYTFCLMMRSLTIYRFETKGLYVNSPFHKEKCISWDEFQEVCVIYMEYHHSKEKPINSCICFVRKGEKKNFLDRWKTGKTFKYDKVITISYTEGIYEGIKEKCPYEIVDFRDTPGYESWK